MKSASLVVLLLLFSVVLVSFPQIKVVKAEGAIIIRADGSVEGTERIQRDGNIYTFLGNISIDVSGIDAIIIERDNIVIDGAGYHFEHLEEPTGDTSEDGIIIDRRNNVTITNVTVQNFLYGIAVTASSNITITKTNILDNHNGIHLVTSHNNSLIDNQIVNNQGNPFSSGIILRSSENNKIDGNTIRANEHGIQSVFSSENIISNNYIARNNVGIYINYGGENQIFQNTIIENRNWGVYLSSANGSRNNNVFYRNNFLHNYGSGLQVSNPWYFGPESNMWDNGEEGNYWSDYNGIDNNGDGIGDTPYLINENNQDNYPLMNPVETDLIKSFEEAIESWAKREFRLWNIGRTSIGDYQGEPFVASDGLTIGYLFWYAGNGSIYEASYPTGEIKGEIFQLRSVNDFEVYYVWRLVLMDGRTDFINARNGNIVEELPGRTPGTLTQQAALRVVNASQPKIEEWSLQKYERIGLEESTEARSLLRTSNGSLYEYSQPIASYPLKEVLRIHVADDTEEYVMWEVTTQNNTYYIDARNGIIRLILSNDKISKVILLPNETIITIIVIIAIFTVFAGVIVYHKRRAPKT